MKIPRSQNLEEIVATNFQNKPRDKSCIKLSGRKNFRTCSKFSCAIQATFVSSAARIVACSFHLDLVNQKSNKVHCTGRSTKELRSLGKRGDYVFQMCTSIAEKARFPLLNEGQMSMATPLEKQVPWGPLAGRP